jgi:hypothetical protein
MMRQISYKNLLFLKAASSRFGDILSVATDSPSFVFALIPHHEITQACF